MLNMLCISGSEDNFYYQKIQVRIICFTSCRITHTVSKNVGVHCNYEEIFFSISTCKYACCDCVSDVHDVPRINVSCRVIR
jgi:hypothetical protein